MKKIITITIAIMAINTKRLNVTEFDFDEVKNNLKVFLSGQTEFTDYDFEGSGMNALLDVLAYNTHYLGFNANMLANEMFLDSASLRSSVVSHAKTLGYIPNSARAAVATVNVVLNTTSVTSATMPAGTIFNSTVNGTDYQFVTSDAVTSSNIGSSIPFVLSSHRHIHLCLFCIEVIFIVFVYSSFICDRYFCLNYLRLPRL